MNEGLRHVVDWSQRWIGSDVVVSAPGRVIAHLDGAQSIEIAWVRMDAKNLGCPTHSDIQVFEIGDTILHNLDELMGIPLVGKYIIRDWGLFQKIYPQYENVSENNARRIGAFPTVCYLYNGLAKILELPHQNKRELTAAEWDKLHAHFGRDSKRLMAGIGAGFEGMLMLEEIPLSPKVAVENNNAARWVTFGFSTDLEMDGLMSAITFDSRRPSDYEKAMISDAFGTCVRVVSMDVPVLW